MDIIVVLIECWKETVVHIVLIRITAEDPVVIFLCIFWLADGSSYPCYIEIDHLWCTFFCVLDSLVSVLCVCHVLGNVSGAWFVMVADGSLWSDQWMGNVRTKWELQNLVSGSTGRLQAWSNQHNTVYLKSKWEVLGVFVSYFNLVSPYSAPENTSCRLSTLSVEFFQLLDLIMILPASSFVFAFLKYI